MMLAPVGRVDAFGAGIVAGERDERRRALDDVYRGSVVSPIRN